MGSIIFVILLWVMIFGLNTLAMIHGWGVEPKSWLIIIFVGWVPSLLMTTLSELFKNN